MSNKSDYFFLNIKQLYPNFARPSELETEIWAELLEPYSLEEIRTGIKSYRKDTDVGFAPTPAKFKSYLKTTTKPTSQPDLPLSPESYLMQADIDAGRCKYFFSTYTSAVKYVLEEKLKAEVSEETFKSYNRGAKYRMAVEYGLFAEFDKVLDYVYEKGYY